MIKARDLVGAIVMLGLILAAAIAANRALDAFDIANEPGATVEQRKLRARERQWDWDHYQSRRSEAPVNSPEFARIILPTETDE